MNLTEFLLARIAEDEEAARAVPPLDHNYDMGGNRQDERYVFDRTLPSSADGMGNWSEHRSSPTTPDHFSRWEPARVLAECEAKRQVVDYATNQHTSCPEATDIVRILALPYVDHPDYRDEWRSLAELG